MNEGIATKNLINSITTMEASYSNGDKEHLVRIFTGGLVDLADAQNQLDANLIGYPDFEVKFKAIGEDKVDPTKWYLDIDLAKTEVANA